MLARAGLSAQRSTAERSGEPGLLLAPDRCFLFLGFRNPFSQSGVWYAPAWVWQLLLFFCESGRNGGM
jgi:hypothetical protein